VVSVTTIETQALARAIVAELEARRSVGGYLLVDVEQAREQLRQVDDTLRRVREAIVAAAAPDVGMGGNDG
jgi:hypothetical protein